MKDNLLLDKSLTFAVRIVRLNQYLLQEKNENIISKQILRSGTSIGANITEANYGQTKADFAAKMQIALKETAETEYWIRLLSMTGYFDEETKQSLLDDCLEIKKMLVSTLKTVKNDE